VRLRPQLRLLEKACMAFHPCKVHAMPCQARPRAKTAPRCQSSAQPARTRRALRCCAAQQHGVLGRRQRRAEPAGGGRRRARAPAAARRARAAPARQRHQPRCARPGSIGTNGLLPGAARPAPLAGTVRGAVSARPLCSPGPAALPGSQHARSPASSSLAWPGCVCFRHK